MMMGSGGCGRQQLTGGLTAQVGWFGLVVAEFAFIK